MTALRQRMLEELQRHNYFKETIRLYLFAVKDFARHFKRRPDVLAQEHMREFQLYLLNERKLKPQTVAGRITASKTRGNPRYSSIRLVSPRISDQR